MKHECLLCSKTEETTGVLDPDGWIVRYDGVKLCDKCKYEGSPLIDFLAELKEAQLAINGAMRVLVNNNILTGRKNQIAGQLGAIAGKIDALIMECRKPYKSEEERQKEIEEVKKRIKSIVEV